MKIDKTAPDGDILYLNTLSVCKHTLTVLYFDGETTGEFEILEKAESNTPGTGVS